VTLLIVWGIVALLLALALRAVPFLWLAGKRRRDF